MKSSGTRSVAKKILANRANSRHSLTAPERVAFLGCASRTNEDGRHLNVQVLCWPTVPAAWRITAQRWQSVCGERGGRDFTDTRCDGADAWIVESAPQLAAPFRGTTAAESSLAALMGRIPMQIALGVADVDGTRLSGEAAHREALSACLAMYDESAQAPGREPFSLLVTRSQGDLADRHTQDTFAVCQKRFSESAWAERAQLRRWNDGNDGVEPLPLECANLLAGSTVRRLTAVAAQQPIFDTLLSKLVRIPLQFAPQRAKRGGR